MSEQQNDQNDGPQGEDAAIDRLATDATIARLEAEIDALRNPDGNPLDRIFSTVRFSPGDNAKFPKPGEPPARDGSTSKRVANVAFVFAGGHHAMEGTVYLRLASGAKVPTVDVTMNAPRFKKAIQPLTTQGTDYMTEFLTGVAKSYLKWQKSQGKAAAVQANKVGAVAADDILESLGEW